MWHTLQVLSSLDHHLEKYNFSISVDNNGNRMRSAPAKNHNVDGRMIVLNLFRL